MSEREWADLRRAFHDAMDEPGHGVQVLPGKEDSSSEVAELLRHLAQAEHFLSVDDERGSHELLAAGTLVCGRYRVVTHLGSGGMGDVYEVEDEHLGEIVALKMLRPQFARSAVALEQLRREVRHARRIVHCNVCREFDLALDGDLRPFLTMERIHGESLSHRLKRMGAISGQQALLFAEQICNGIAAAHDRQIVHGDLKPHNILVVDSPLRLVVCDFGLSRYEAPADGSAATFSRVAAGTPAFLAPERYEGSPASYAGDLYSLGVILHQIVTGELPSAKRNEQGKKIMAPTVPAGWAAAIVACLCLNPAERPASARDVFSMLQPTHKRQGLPVAVRWAALAVGLGVAAASATMLQGSRHRHETGSQATSLATTGDPSLQDVDYVTAGSVYLNRQTPKAVNAALATVQSGLAHDPDSVRGNALLSRIFTRKYELSREQRWLSQSQTALSRAEQESPGSGDVLLAKGVLERNEGNLRGAIADLRRSVDVDRSDTEGWRQLGRSYNQIGNILQAQEAYEQGLQLDSSSWSLHCELGWFYYSHNQYGRAETELLRAEALAPDSALVQANLGGMYLAAGRLDEARRALVRAQDFDPSANVASNLGSLYLKLNRPKDAIAEYRKACDLNPSDYRIWINLAVALGREEQEKEQNNAYAHAISLLTASLQVSPNDAHLLMERALYQAVQKQSAEAAASEAQALKIAPADPSILLQAAGVEARLGRRTEAQALIDRAQDLGATAQQVQALSDAQLVKK